ncbi:MAG: hypothetical protein DMF98_20535 [Acidobacteria bacterium]|nr:MAG: hypothetical protein DMF98_20535 [Acidobacteriota bacterium]
MPANHSEIRQISHRSLLVVAGRYRATLDAAKVTVFLLDEHQYMRPDEIGETKLIGEATKRRGIPLAAYDLDTQFRCAGSQEYMWWVDWVLGFRTTPPEDWRGKYRLDFTTSPDDLDDFVAH